MHHYRCDVCGCYLDPNEGFRCEDCIAKSKKKMERNLLLMDMIAVDSNGQYEMVSFNESNQLI